MTTRTRREASRMEATLLRGADKEEEEAEAKSAEDVMINSRYHGDSKIIRNVTRVCWCLNVNNAGA